MRNVLILWMSVQITTTVFSQEPVKNSFSTREKAFDLKVQTEKEGLLPEGKQVKLVVPLTKDQKGQPSLLSPNGVPISVTNAEKLKSLPSGIPFVVEASNEGGQIKVSRVSIKPVDTWDATKENFPVAQFGSLHRSLANLKDVVNRLQTTNSMSADSPDLSQALNEAEEGVVTTFQKNESQLTPKQRKDLARSHAELRQIRLKATYSRLDLYDPIIYKRIYDNSRTAVALFYKPKARVYGSGVLIGKNLVLTCRHCIDVKDFGGVIAADDMEVWFDYENELGNERKKVRFEVAAIPFMGIPNERTDSPLEFALLQLKPFVEEGKPPCEAGDMYPPATLARAAEQDLRDDAIYVIGHPDGKPRTVHDNSFVLFPFRVKPNQFADLQLIVENESKLDEPGNWLKEFLDSYLPPDPQDKVREQYSVRWGKLPVLAADCDTYHGNSGSGAWNRTTNRVIGLLFAGEPDQEQGDATYQPGWRRHEAILPVREIIRQLDQKMPDWKATYGVKVGP